MHESKTMAGGLMEIADALVVVLFIVVFYKPLLWVCRWLVDRAWKFLSDL